MRFLVLQTAGPAAPKAAQQHRCGYNRTTAMTAEASNAAEADYSNDGDDTDWQPSPMESD